MDWPELDDLVWHGGWGPGLLSKLIRESEGIYVSSEKCRNVPFIAVKNDIKPSNTISSFSHANIKKPKRLSGQSQNSALPM